MNGKKLIVALFLISDFPRPGASDRSYVDPQGLYCIHFAFTSFTEHSTVIMTQLFSSWLSPFFLFTFMVLARGFSASTSAKLVKREELGFGRTGLPLPDLFSVTLEE